MNISSGVQNISFPGENPVYVYPAYNKAPVDPIKPASERAQIFHPEKAKILAESGEKMSGRGNILDILA